MNRRRIIGFILSVIAVPLLFSSCADKAPAVTSAALTTPLPSSSQASPALALPSGYTVKTDDSKLTPYQRPEEIYTRLSQGYMPELIPSKDYGMLLPYVGNKITSEAWGDFYYYGLVTKSGLIVTDSIYAGIYRPQGQPYYVLFKPEEIITADGNKHGIEKYALCTLDGSWITAFDYEYISCCDSVILLIRDSKRNDIDVMDYSRNLLYNTTMIKGYAQLQPYTFFDPLTDQGRIQFSDNDGYLAITNRETGARIYVNETSGEITQVSYEDCSWFSDGYAAVEKDGLWGYINTSFSETIKPEYLYASEFEDERAVVSLTSGENAVIDTAGNILYTSKLSISYENGFYIVSDFAGKKTLILNKDLREIFNSESSQSWDTFYYDDNFGFSFVSNNVTTVCIQDKVTSIPGEYSVIWMIGDILYCSNKANPEQLLMTLDGKVIKDSWNKNKHISAFKAMDNQTYFIENADEGYSDNEYIYSHSLLDATGKVLFSGKGNMQFKEEYGYLEISSADYFAYMDTSGKYIFKKSLMDSIPD